MAYFLLCLSYNKLLTKYKEVGGSKLPTSFKHVRFTYNLAFIIYLLNK